MARQSKQRHLLVLESLESREVLSGAAPAAELQYALELVNLTRTNPAVAADRLASSLSEATEDTLDFFGVDLAQARREVAAMQTRQPLAWNEQLAKAAEDHSRDMAEKGFQSHTGSDGSTADQRMARHGYNGATRAAENAFAYAESVDHAIQAFVIDWGVADKGHRRNLLEPDNGGDDSFKDIGIGLVASKRTGMGKVMTQNLAVRPNTSAQLLGVAYNDKDRDRFYDIGEGQGGVTVEVTAPDGKITKLETAAPGGYQVALAPGRYKVRAVQGDREIQSREVQIGSKNVKLDFLMNEATAASTQPSTSRPVPTVVTTKPTTSVKPTTVTAKPAKAAVVKTASTTPVKPVSSGPSTVLSNVTPTVASTPAPRPVIEPTQIGAFGVQSGFSWNTWNSVPKA